MFSVLSKKNWLIATAISAPSAIALSLSLGIYQTSQAQASKQKRVTINFAAQVGEQAFTCGKSYSDLGTSATIIAPSDFRLYISDVALIDANDQAIPLNLEQDDKWQARNVALLDFEDKSGACSNGTVETRNKIVGTIPPGNYQGLQFRLGIPAELNHADATLAASPLNLTSLWWNWRGGYKFMRLDLVSQNTTLQGKENKSQYLAHQVNPGSPGNQTFPIHIGSTGCQAATESQKPENCSNPNQSTIKLDNFKPDNNVVVADVANLLTQTDLSTNQADTPMGCMSSPEDRDCFGIMHKLGLGFNNQPSSGQTFFRVK